MWRYMVKAYLRYFSEQIHFSLKAKKEWIPPMKKWEKSFFEK